MKTNLTITSTELDYTLYISENFTSEDYDAIREAGMTVDEVIAHLMSIDEGIRSLYA